MGKRAFAALIDIAIVSLVVAVSVLAFGRRVHEGDSAAEVRRTLDFVRDNSGNLLLSDGRPQLVGFTRVLDLGDTTIVFQGWVAVLGVWLLPLASIFLIGGLMQGRSGVTPGKAIFGVQTVDELGRLPGLRRASLRTAAWIVDGFPFLVPLVGPILAFSSPGHQRLGDRIGRTFVVDNAFAGELLDIPGLSAVVEPDGPTRQVVFTRAARNSVAAETASDRLSPERPVGTTVTPLKSGDPNQEQIEHIDEYDPTLAEIAAHEPTADREVELHTADESPSRESHETEETDETEDDFGDTAIDRDAVAAELAGLNLRSSDDDGEGLRRRQARRQERSTERHSTPEAAPADAAPLPHEPAGANAYAPEDGPNSEFSVHVDDETQSPAALDLTPTLSRRRARKDRAKDNDRPER